VGPSAQVARRGGGSTWRGGGVGACAVRRCCRARASEARGREVGDADVTEQNIN
jgi:hypothetical protein